MAELDHFLKSRAPLTASDAAAALLVLEDGRYVLQRRDDFPHIWYPGHWGLFGGSVDNGEDAMEALRRELSEELELDMAEARLFVRFKFDLAPIGLKEYFRAYYEVPVTLAEFDRLVLREGAEMRALPGDEALALPHISPYDAFALFLHYRKLRLVGPAEADQPGRANDR
jgi:8-oxo-dGTP pyrophosphatase MutT (NUDIX family)